MIVRLDRLARSVPHLLQVLDQLTDRGAGLRSLRDPIDTTTAGGRFTLTILGAVAELERSLIIERTRAGVAAAARAGRLPGHPGLRARDPATTRQLAANRRGHALDRSAPATGAVAGGDRADRPASWETIARRIAAGGGPDWSGERLRRTWLRLQSAENTTATVGTGLRSHSRIDRYQPDRKPDASPTRMATPSVTIS